MKPANGYEKWIWKSSYCKSNSYCARLRQQYVRSRCQQKSIGAFALAVSLNQLRGFQDVHLAATRRRIFCKGLASSSAAKWFCEDAEQNEESSFIRWNKLAAALRLSSGNLVAGCTHGAGLFIMPGFLQLQNLVPPVSGGRFLPLMRCVNRHRILEPSDGCMSTISGHYE